MKIHETCGCGASIEVDGIGPYAEECARQQIDAWRSNHKHVLCRPASTESNEQGRAGVILPERDPRSTTALEHERADEFGFGLGGSVIA